MNKKENPILHILPAQAKQKPKKQKKGPTQSAPVQKLADVIGPKASSTSSSLMKVVLVWGSLYLLKTPFSNR